MAPLWLETAKKLRAIADSGLFFSDNPYERERYEQVAHLSDELIAHYANISPEKVNGFYKNDTGYITPKIDIRSVVIKDNGFLFVKEKVDGKWTFPGGYADIGYTPFEVAVKETLEEAGINVKPVRLLAIMDKKRHSHPPSPFYMYKIFILCEILSGNVKAGSETLDAKFFPYNTIPELSLERLTEGQYKIIMERCLKPDLPVYCE